MRYSKYHVHEGGTAVTNFDKDRKDIYQKAIDLYGSDALSIGPAMYPLHGNKNYLALHIDESKHPFYLSKFWQIFNSIAYTLKDAPWMVRYKDHSVFNEYQMKKHGFSRIN